MAEKTYVKAIYEFRQIPGYKDSDEQLLKAQEGHEIENNEKLFFLLKSRSNYIAQTSKKLLLFSNHLLIVVRGVLVVRMLGQIVFVGHERSDTTQLKDALAAIQDS